MKRVWIWLAVCSSVTPAFAQEAARTDVAFLQGSLNVVAQECPAETVPRRLLPREESACLLSVRALIQQRSFAAARERITALERADGSGDWRAQLQLALADAYYVEGRWVEARTAYHAAAGLARGTAFYPQALYGEGRAAQYAGDLAAARELLAGVVRAASWSFEADSARDILREDAHLSVQVGSFQSRDNAVRLLKDLQSRGHEAYLSEAVSGGRTLHRVRVGRFTSYAEAARRHEELDRLGFTSRVWP